MAVIEFESRALAGRALKDVNPGDVDFASAGELILQEANRGELSDGRLLTEALNDVGLTDPVGIGQHLKVMLERAQGLRHASVIDGAHAGRWIVNAFAQEPSRLGWHIRRLDGIGPSGAWAYVAEARGERCHFARAHDLDSTRMMIRLPDRANSHMLRGQLLEPIAQHVFLALTQSRTDVAATQAVSRVVAPRDHPWLSGSLDDIVIDPNGSRLLIDYKCPTELNLGSPIEDVYATQLSLYWMRSQLAGVNFSGSGLWKLRLPPAVSDLFVGLLAQNPDWQANLCAQAMTSIGMKLDDGIEVGYKKFHRQDAESRLPEIIEVLDSADAAIQRGTLAPYFRPRKLDIEEELLNEILRVEEGLAAAIAIEKAADEQKSRLKALMDDLIGSRDLAGVEKFTPRLRLTTARTFSAEAAIEELERRMIPTDGMRITKSTEGFDVAQIKATLAANEIPVDQFETLSQRAGLSMSKADKPAIDALREKASKAVGNLVGTRSDPPRTERPDVLRRGLRA